MLNNHWFFNGFKGRNAGWLVGWLAGCLSGRLVHFTFTLHSNVWFSWDLNVEKPLVFQWFQREVRWLAGGLTGWLSEWSTGPFHLHPSFKCMIFPRFKCWTTIGFSMVLKGGTLAGWWADWLVGWVVDWSTSPSPFIQVYDFWILEIEMLKNIRFFNSFKGMSAGWLGSWLTGCLNGLNSRLVHFTCTLYSMRGWSAGFNFTPHSNFSFLNSQYWNVEKPMVFQRL